MLFQFPYSQNTAPIIFVLNYVAKCTVGGIVDGMNYLSGLMWLLVFVYKV